MRQERSNIITLSVVLSSAVRNVCSRASSAAAMASKAAAMRPNSLRVS